MTNVLENIVCIMNAENMLHIKAKKNINFSYSDMYITYDDFH